MRYLIAIFGLCVACLADNECTVLGLQTLERANDILGGHHQVICIDANALITIPGGLVVPVPGVANGDVVVTDTLGHLFDPNTANLNAIITPSFIFFGGATVAPTGMGFLNIGFLSGTNGNGYAELGDNVGDDILFDNPAYFANTLISNSDRTFALINQYTTTPGSGATTFLYGNPLSIGIGTSGTCHTSCVTPSHGFAITTTGVSVLGTGFSTNSVQTIGTTFTASGCSNSTLVGGSTSGSFKSGTTGTCTVTITMGSSVTATNGYACFCSDQTTPANLCSQKTGGNTTTAILQGTTVTNDIISFGCLAY